MDALAAAAALDRPDLVDDLAHLSGGAKWGVHIGIGPDDPVSVAAREVELYEMSNAYGVEAATLAAAAQAAEPASIWALIVSYSKRRTVGSMRLVGGDPEAWEFCRDLTEFWDMSFAHACEIAAVSPQSRLAEGGSFSIRRDWRTEAGGWPTKLVLAAYVHAVEELGLDATMQTANPRVLRIASKFGVPSVKVARPMSFGGVWKANQWVPAIAPSQPARSWLRVGRDSQMAALVLDRDTAGFGGTRLPSKDEWAAARLHYDGAAGR